jgi:hypothetical protein
MSDITAPQSAGFKWQLLSTVSAMAMLAAVSVSPAQADPMSLGDGAHIWFDIGGQLTDYASNPTTVFNDPTTPGSAIFIGPSGGWDTDAKFSFEPAGSDLIFSAKLRYGRTNPKNFVGYGTLGTTGGGGEGAVAAALAHGHAHHAFGRHAAGVHAAATGTGTGPNYIYYSGFLSHKEDHAIVDFTVGKDFGLGMFGHDGNSIFSIGVRYAQFNARTDIGYYTGTISSTSFSEKARLTRSFNGIGPVIAWDASAPLGGDFSSELSVDWGLDASMLFGKQKMTLAASYSTGPNYTATRRKTTTVPSVGGYLALSWHGGEGTKVSLGYRADDYFKVLDGGFDTANKIDRAFYGPFIKVGISD